MLIVNLHEGEQINEGIKIWSLRPIRASGKGYLTIGSLQYIYVGRDFKADPVARVLMLNRSFINIGELTAEDFQALGYPSKAEYMEQPYNKRNPSPERVKYEFIELGNLAEFVESLEWTPSTFAEVWDMVGNCKELAQGVEPSLIFEGCDLQDLEETFQTIQANILEAMP